VCCGAWLARVVRETLCVRCILSMKPVVQEASDLHSPCRLQAIGTASAAVATTRPACILQGLTLDTKRYVSTGRYDSAQSQSAVRQVTLTYRQSPWIVPKPALLVHRVAACMATQRSDFTWCLCKLLLAKQVTAVHCQGELQWQSAFQSAYLVRQSTRTTLCTHE